MIGAEEQAPASDAGSWTFEYDESLLSIEAVDGDYTVVPARGFEETLLIVHTADADYEITLLNCAMNQEALVDGEAVVTSRDGSEFGPDARMRFETLSETDAAGIIRSIEHYNYLIDLPGKTPKKNVKKAFRQTASETRYQVFSISLDNVDQSEYDFHVALTLPEPVAGSAYRLYHIHEGKVSEIGSFDRLTRTVAGREVLAGIEFDVDNFSEFVLSYTVDFYYESAEYHMEGEGQLLLSRLFEALGIDRSVADVADVAFSDESLVSVEKVAFEDGQDWMLTSLEPFQSIESLIVTFSDGSVLEVRVEDAQNIRINLVIEGNGSVKLNSGTYTASQNNVTISVKANGTNNNGMTATAASGYTFDGWKVNGMAQTAGASVSAGEISLTNGCTLTAVFRSTAGPSYNITYTAEGGGTVSKASGTSTEVGAVAYANEGYHFVGWRLNGSIVSANPVFDTSLVTSNCTVTAVFAEDTGDEAKYFQRYYYTVNPIGAGNTIQLVDKNGANKGDAAESVDCETNTFENGKDVNNGNSALLARPVAGPGYHFVGWTNNRKIYSGVQDGTYAIQPKGEDKDVPGASNYHESDTFVANFAPDGRYLIYTLAGEGGSVTGAGVYTNSPEDMYRISNGVMAMPDEGYKFVHWVNSRGEHQSYDDRLRIFTSDVTEDTWFMAIFEPVTDVNVYYTCDPLRGTVTPEHEYVNLEKGAEGAVAEPYDGYRFISWVNEQGETVWGTEDFQPDDDMIYEGATFTAVFEPDTYATYTWVGADTDDENDDRPCGYITSRNYTNTVNNRVVAMYIREDGKLPGDLTANAYEEYVFDHWEFNGEVLEGVGETIPQYYDLRATGKLKEGRSDNTLIAYYAPNPNITWHTIHYVADPSLGGTVSNSEDRWYGSNTSTIVGATAVAKAGYEFAGWVERTDDPNVILPTTNNKTATFKPEGDQCRDTTYYAMFRKTTGASGLVGYNMNIRDVPVSWSGPKDFVMTSGAGATMYYDNKNGAYYTTDEYFNLSTAVPSAEGYAFLGWFDKDRPEYSGDKRKDAEGNYTYQPARLLRGGEGTRCRFVFNGDAGGRYTVEAVWAGLKAESKRLPYDGAEHNLLGECFLERGTLPDTPRYERQLTALLNHGGYDLGRPTYQLIAQDGVLLENQPVTNSFSRVQPGLYTVKVTAKGTFRGSPFTLEKVITLEIYPAKVIIIKYWENDTEETRPEELEVEKTWLSNAPLHKFGKTDVTAEQMAGRPEDHEPEWTKRGSTWIKEYDDVLVRSEGIEETDQDSYYYEYYAEEVVPEGYTQVGGAVREVSEDRLTTTITFRNTKTSLDLEKHWYNADGEEINNNTPVTLKLFRKDGAGHSVQIGDLIQVVAGEKTTVPITDHRYGYTYYVEEVGIDGYTTTYSCHMPDDNNPWDDVGAPASVAVPVGGTLIVRNRQESTKLSVAKAWMINGSLLPADRLPTSFDGEEINAVTYQLWRHDPSVPDAAAANEQYGENRQITAQMVDNKYVWKDTVENLPKYVLDENGAVKVDGEGQPYRYSYYVVEVDAPAGFTVKVTAEVEGETRDIGASGEKLESGEITITNGMYSVALPNTGGPGITLLYTLGGALLILGAAILLARRRFCE